jgi:hypothetical protein
MKTVRPLLMRVFLSMIFAVTAATSAYARPIFIIMDVDRPENTPSQFGYAVAATASGDEIHFALNLDSNASAAFKSAFLFFHTPVAHQPVIHAKVSTTGDKRKQITFAVPTQHIGHCILQIDSAPIRPQEPIANFFAYRLRLDNIKQE